ncbi:MAG TPA: threonine--tRNA ligase [Gammaproteobacteria bacterium]|nr:threonine--tRNA ligase [Gammaproteobacteria bacterium]
MPAITLPDGKKLSFDQVISVHDVATAIGPGLAKSALAGKVNGTLVDTAFIIDQDATLQIITERDPEGLEVIRHSCAHLFAQALKSLYPDAQISIGPVITDGFYYDFSYKTKAFTEADFPIIEQKMAELAASDMLVSRHVFSRADAIALFKAKGEHYKVEIIQDIPGEEPLSFYQQGDFIDLCRGPHVPNTGKIKVFKLMKIAGAYWRGDSKNEMLQRIYGTAWTSKKDLETYLHQLEEAEKRDHRKLAKKLDLFHFQEEAPGMVFWHPKGWAVYQVVEQYMRKTFVENGYNEVRTPQIVDRTLWERSGHWEKYQPHMFTLKAEARDYAIKPMNCPCHVQIFNQGLKSYRDLPLRLAEFGSCHRNEDSGALHGLMRVRNFVQDDAHIFCTEDQIQAEVAAFNELLFRVYADFGFKEIIVKLSTRPEHRVGSDEIWDKAEAALIVALNQTGLSWTLAPGDGAFYGPKIDYSCKDSLGRIWQCGTIQVDFSMPERLGASYIAEDGARRVPVMVHRAILGSLERFIGILIEETGGSLPTWLAPVQVVVLSITSAQADFAHSVAQSLQKQGFRVEEDLRNEKIGFKIREHTIQRVPYLLVVGDREVTQNQVAVRTRAGIDLGSMAAQEFVNQLSLEVANHSL